MEDIPEDMRPRPAQSILVAPGGLGAQGTPCARDADCHSRVCWRGSCGESAPPRTPERLLSPARRAPMMRTAGRGFVIGAFVRICLDRCTTVSSVSLSALVSARLGVVRTSAWRVGAAPANRMPSASTGWGAETCVAFNGDVPGKRCRRMVEGSPQESRRSPPARCPNRLDAERMRRGGKPPGATEGAAPMGGMPWGTAEDAEAKTKTRKAHGDGTGTGRFRGGA
jgi:hypothetical protein